MGGVVGWVVKCVCVCVCVCVYNECDNLHNARPWTGES